MTLPLSESRSEPTCESCLPETGAVASPLPMEVPTSGVADEAASNDRLAAFCKALGHPARVQILKLLIARQSCVCGEIVEVLPLAQSTVSEHLRILKKASLIQGEIEGNRSCYCVNPGAIAQLKMLINGL